MKEATKEPVKPRRHDRLERQVKWARVLGLAFSLAGFVAIALGWNGMARQACPDCQLPYLLSGGAGGIGLVVFGVGLLLMAQVRAERIKLIGALEGMTRAMRRIPALGSTGSINGHVVAGPSSYHRADCRLVQGKTDVEVLTTEAARMSGLTPCRVCRPERLGAPVAEEPVMASGTGEEPSTVIESREDDEGAAVSAEAASSQAPGDDPH